MNLSSAIANEQSYISLNPTHGSILKKKQHIFGLVETRVHAALAMPAPLAALGAIFQAFPPLRPCEPRLRRGEMQAVPCGARSNTRLLPASTSQPPPAGTRFVRKYNTGMYLYSSKNGPYIRTRLVTPQEKNKQTGSTTPTDAFAPASTSGRPLGGRAQAGLPLPAPMLTHSRRDPGPKRPRAAGPQTPH